MEKKSGGRKGVAGYLTGVSFPASNNVNASGFRFLATKTNCRPDCSTLPVEEDRCHHRLS